MKKVHILGSHIELDYDPANGVDVFAIQVLSAAENAENVSDLLPVLVDAQGCPVETTDDMEDADEVLWCADRDAVGGAGVTQRFCSRALVQSSEELLQPSYRIVDTDIQLCGRCCQLFDPSLIVTDVGQLCAFTCAIERAIETGLALCDARACLDSDAAALARTVDCGALPVALFIKRTLLKRAIEAQSASSSSSSSAGLSAAEHDFQRRIESGCQTVNAYEDEAQQEAARAVVDYAKVHEHAENYLRETREQQQQPGAPADPGAFHEDVAFLHGLLRWFKWDFFKWVNKPPCDNPSCQAGTARMQPLGGGQPTAEERTLGDAGRVETYRCGECDHMTRFARYNNAAYLVTHPKHRRGRCGEWANAFCLICRALGWDARYVLDFTDHVWVEVWVPSWGRYVHADPCEKRLDAPLLYEAGWGKKLTHVLSFSRHGCVDASPRYSRTLKEVILRRSAASALAEKFVADRDSAVTELFVARTIERMDRMQEDRHVARLAARGVLFSDTTEPPLVTLSLLSGGAAAFAVRARNDVPVPVLQRRKRRLARELHGFTLLTVADDKAREVAGQGRISGDQEWVASRGEGGAPAPAPLPVPAPAAIEKPPRKYLCPSGAAAPVPPPWLVPGVVVSTSALLGTSALDRHVDVSAASFGFDACQRAPRGAPPAAALGPVFATRDASTFVGALCTSVGARGRAATSVSADGALSASRCVLPAPGADASDGEAGAGVAVAVVTTVESTRPDAGGAEGTDGADASVVRLVLPAGSEPLPGAACAVVASSGARLTVDARVSDGQDRGVVAAAAVDDGRDAAMMRARVALPPPPPGPSPQHPTPALVAVPGGWTCTHATSLLFKEPAEGREAFVDRARAACLADHAALGVVVDRLGEVAAVFGDAGHPLRPCDGSTAHLKTLPTAASGAAAAGTAAALPPPPPPSPAAAATVSVSASVSALVQYVPLGGGQHADTLAFDSTQFLWPALDHLRRGHTDADADTDTDTDTGPAGRGRLRGLRGLRDADLWRALRVDEVKLWAGPSLVNGCDLSYSLPATDPYGHDAAPAAADAADGVDGGVGRLVLRSPSLSSTHDDPVPHALTLAPGDAVVHVAVRSGALVDSVTVTTAHGHTLRCGGTGGGDARELTIPDGWRFLGLYGGTGGHLHHVGVVVLRVPDHHHPTTPPPHVALALRLPAPLRRLWALAEDRFLWPTAAQRAPAPPRPTPPRRHVARTCLETVALYAENMAAHPADKKFRRIKTTNAFVRKHVLVADGGLPLLCFGPCAFRLATDLSCVDAAVTLFAEGGDLSRDDFRTALGAYAGFLRAAVTVLYGHTP